MGLNYIKSSDLPTTNMFSNPEFDDAISDALNAVVKAPYDIVKALYAIVKALYAIVMDASLGPPPAGGYHSIPVQLTPSLEFDQACRECIESSWVFDSSSIEALKTFEPKLLIGNSARRFRKGELVSFMITAIQATHTSIWATVEIEHKGHLHPWDCHILVALRPGDWGICTHWGKDSFYGIRPGIQPCEQSTGFTTVTRDAYGVDVRGQGIVGTAVIPV